MLNRIVLFMLLCICWIILSGSGKPSLLVAGAFSCLLSVLIGIRMYGSDKLHGAGVAVLLIRLPVYGVWLLKEMVVSGIDVATKVWQVEPEISPRMEWVPISFKDDVGLTVLGTSITLTPGTVTVLVRKEGMIQVHALTKEALKGLREGEMANKVAAFTA